MKIMSQDTINNNGYSCKPMNFRELLVKNYKIRIPSIQREYAYGNTDEKTTEKREKFLDFIFDALKKDQETSLDFVYGYTHGDYLEPLDGQQRLTTLFLLYWLFAEDAIDILFDKTEKKSRFSYATRPTTQDFCNALCQQKASDLLDKWDQNKDKFFSDFLQQQGWVLWQWRQDPSIKSMLNMLNAMVKRKQQLKEEGKLNLDNLTFYFLELKDGVAEDIYVKMNARGKQLSKFDLYKSNLEEKLKTVHNNAFEQKWRTHVDGDWLQFFWHNYGPLCVANDQLPEYADFNIVEDTYLTFWERLTDLYNLYLYSNKQNKSKEQDKFEEEKPSIYIKQLHEDINALLYKNKDNQMTDISQHLMDITFDFDKNKSLFDLMINKNENKKKADDLVFNEPSIPIQVMFLGMLLFARKFDKNIHCDKDVIKNFHQYMYVVCNILLNENQERDWEKKEIPSIYQTLENLVEEFEKQYTSSKESFDVFLSKRSLKHDNKIDLYEEIWKAKLRQKDPAELPNGEKSWNTLIGTAEKNDYFRGQIIHLLRWTLGSEADDTNATQVDKTKFESYFHTLTELLIAAKDVNTAYLIYGALLTIRDYKRQIGGTTGVGTKYRLFRFYNKTGYDTDRDYSWKRALPRYEQTDVLKEFIDKWNTENQARKQKSNPLLDVASYCKYLINQRKKTTDYREWLIENPELLEKSPNKLIGKESNEHWYVLVSSQFSPKQQDIFLAVLAKKLTSLKPKLDRYTLSFTYKGNDYKLTTRPHGKYGLFIGENAITDTATSSELWDDQSVLNYFQKQKIC